MARPKSTSTLLNQLTIEQQIMVQGIQAMLQDRIKASTPAESQAARVLTQQFLNWLANERADLINLAITEFAIARASS